MHVVTVCFKSIFLYSFLVPLHVIDREIIAASDRFIVPVNQDLDSQLPAILLSLEGEHPYHSPDQINAYR